MLRCGGNPKEAVAGFEPEMKEKLARWQARGSELKLDKNRKAESKDL